MTKKLTLSVRSHKRSKAPRKALNSSTRLRDLVPAISNILLSPDDCSSKMMMNDQSSLSILDSTMDQTHGDINNSHCHFDDTMHQVEHSMGNQTSVSLSKVQTQLNSAFLRAINNIQKEDKARLLSEYDSDINDAESLLLDELKYSI
jgi:hypothetical protein